MLRCWLWNRTEGTVAQRTQVPPEARKDKDTDPLWSLWEKRSPEDSLWTSYFQNELVGFLKTETLL